MFNEKPGARRQSDVAARVRELQLVRAGKRQRKTPPGQCAYPYQRARIQPSPEGALAQIDPTIRNGAWWSSPLCRLHTPRNVPKCKQTPQHTILSHPWCSEATPARARHTAAAIGKKSPEAGSVDSREAMQQLWRLLNSPAVLEVPRAKATWGG